MALVEVDESQWTALRGIAGTVEKMLANPKTRRKILEAQKEVNPNVAIPEIDEVNRGMERYAELQAKIDEQNKKLVDWESKQAERERRLELEGRWRGGQGKLRKAGWTDEGITAVEKLMEDRCIADHEAAAALYEKMNPPQVSSPISPSGSRFDLFAAKSAPVNEDAMKALMAGNDEAYLSMVIPKTLNDVRSGR